MGKIKIYLSLQNGELVYRDTEEHKGETITTTVNGGDSITWKLDQCSGIKDITNITIKGAKGFFSKGPEKKDFDNWKAEVGKKAKGEIEYVLEVEKCDCCQTEKLVVEKLGLPKPPKIVIDPT
jgi:hypothetical protein